MNEDEFNEKMNLLIKIGRVQGAFMMTVSFTLGIGFSWFMEWISFVWK